MNDIDELLASIHTLAIRLEEQTSLLDYNTRKLRGDVATLSDRLKAIYRATDMSEAPKNG